MYRYNLEQQNNKAADGASWQVSSDPAKSVIGRGNDDC